jgi:hypothetical protein
MFAIVRLNSFDQIKLAASPALEQFDQIHRTQPWLRRHHRCRLASRSPPGAQSLGERGVQRGSLVGPRARGRPAPGTAHVPPV